MRERPILFSAPMVRAILAGAKTQTRRVVKNTGLYAIDAAIHGEENARRELLALASRCPYGATGDRLWVREAWGIADKWLHDCETDPPRCIAYRANRAARNFDPAYEVNTSNWAFTHMKWRPSIHMPRWASRITLEITGVRVERLQDISEADAVAEGVWRTVSGHYSYGDEYNPSYTTARDAFRGLWQSINGPGSWDANPWVWVVEFQRVGQQAGGREGGGV